MYIITDVYKRSMLYDSAGHVSPMKITALVCHQKQMHVTQYASTGGSF